MKIKGNIENKGKGGKGWWLEGVVAKGRGGGATAILKRNIQKESTMLISKYSSS